MQKHRNKIITAVIIVAVLTAAWFFGGNYVKHKGDINSKDTNAAENTSPGFIEKLVGGYSSGE